METSKEKYLQLRKDFTLADCRVIYENGFNEFIEFAERLEEIEREIIDVASE